MKYLGPCRNTSMLLLIILSIHPSLLPSVCNENLFSSEDDRVKSTCNTADVIRGPCQIPDDHDSAAPQCMSDEKVGLGLQLFTSLEDWVSYVKPCLLVRENFPIDPIKANFVRQVANAVFSYALPSTLKSEVQLVAVADDVMENVLDLHRSVSEQEFFHAFVSGNTILQHVPTLAHRYGGHQFGSWAGQLGDGRAHLIGEYTNRKNETWELQLKGSGLTPYSRRGDGRAVLRSSVREFLCSEAMHHLHIPTSRAVSLIVSNDPVIRDQFYNGHPKQERAAVVLRLAPTWFRFGSLEILAISGEKHLLRKLVDFIIVQYNQDIDVSDPDKYLMFYSNVVTMTAELIAQWQSVGFAHGVMNTDNFSILSLTIDYGPFGFLDEYNPKFVPNYSDDEGRYSFENQPSVGLYNLQKLEKVLKVLVPEDHHIQLTKITSFYMDIYKSKFMAIHRRKLGLLNEHNHEDNELIEVFLKMMEDTRADFAMTFRQLSSLTFKEMSSAAIPDGLWALKQLQQHRDFDRWMKLYADRIKLNGEGDGDQERQKRMNKINPRYILRNWIAQSAIEKAERNDFDEVKLLSEVLRNPFEEQDIAESKGWASKPPSWAKKLKVSCSS
ncbi:protein adenylyltransferase SelO-like [Anneissia japonica]|uniref:protein adenylyltransferase SelO-like n=1 Tax=Anneissia japonica TaxID=1529436 RepID=UPI00142599AD|nr:protein adenylyltransferase SelO-like [Anneissia japonica]